MKLRYSRSRFENFSVTNRCAVSETPFFSVSFSKLQGDKAVRSARNRVDENESPLTRNVTNRSGTRAVSEVIIVIACPLFAVSLYTPVTVVCWVDALCCSQKTDNY